jgi:hypothetical protein
MPKNPIDYQNTIIYKIEHIVKEDLIYVGHTTNWDRRKYSHKQRCLKENNSKHNLKLYQMMRGNGGWEMFRMIEIEKYPCNDRREAEKRECEVMKELRANMNMILSYVSEEENKRRKTEYNKYYFQTHKDIIQEVRKDYHKEYRELNKEKIQINKKEYIEKNKEVI